MIRARLPGWGALLPLLVLFVLIGPASLQAGIAVDDSVFTFSGLCTDCSGYATATLTLRNYTQGNPIMEGNLVSFYYGGTNLLPAFTILAGEESYVGGMIPVSLAAPANFDIYIEPGMSFSSGLGGEWSAGPFQTPADEGTNGIWNGAAVPEPGAFMLVAAGMVVIGVRRWKVQR